MQEPSRYTLATGDVVGDGKDVLTFTQGNSSLIPPIEVETLGRTRDETRRDGKDCVAEKQERGRGNRGTAAST
jgi:hypothetical protein